MEDVIQCKLLIHDLQQNNNKISYGKKKKSNMYSTSKQTSK